MKVQIQELAIEHDGLTYRLKFINSPTAVTVDLLGFPMTHRGVNIELVDGQWAFVPAPGFGEVETAKDEQLRDPRRWFAAWPAVIDAFLKRTPACSRNSKPQRRPNWRSSRQVKHDHPMP